MNRADTHARMKGPVVPINICFNDDGTVDYEAVAGYVSWLAEQGISILMLTYGSSEYAGLSDVEVYTLTETVGKANDGRSFFISSTKYWKPADTRKFIAHADACGVDAVKVQVDSFNQTAEALPRYFDQIEGVNDMPLLMWTIAQPMLPVATAVEMSRRPYIIGMKNDADMFAGYYDYTRGSIDNQFGVISGGQMRNFAFGYKVGSPAYLCPIAPFRPAIAMEFYQLLVDGNDNAAWEMVFTYEEPFLNWAIDKNWLAVMKSTIQLLGFYPNNLLGPPQPPPDPSLLGEVRDKLGEIFPAA